MTHRLCQQGAEYSIIPFAEKHLPTFTAWFNALPNNRVWTESSIRRRTLEDPVYDLELMFAVVELGDPVGFMLGSTREDRGWVRAFLVRPDKRRRGIGTLMFDVIERRLAERGISEVHAGWALPSYFLPGIDIKYTSAIVFLEQRGYHTSREARVNMDVIIAGRDWGTEQAEDQLEQRGIRVRRAQPEDEPGITRLCERHGHNGWAVETGMALQERPVTVFVAELDSLAGTQDSIQAFATHSVSGPVHFGPMLTAAGLRGQGVGTVLLKRCLQDWQQAGVSQCEIVWAGPLSFYARTVGATIGRAFWAFEKSLT
jgi:mycothiol synthase